MRLLAMIENSGVVEQFLTNLGLPPSNRVRPDSAQPPASSLFADAPG